MDKAQLVKWRKDAGYTQEKAARAADVSLRTITRLEGGKGVSVPASRRIAAVYKVDLEEFLAVVFPPQAAPQGQGGGAPGGADGGSHG